MVGEPIVIGARMKGDDGRGYEWAEDVSEGGPVGPLNTVALAVRRLTPRECMRLQGFQWVAGMEDGAWCDQLGRWWSEDYLEGISDSAIYRMLGNAVCVAVAEWLGRRIASSMKALECVQLQSN